MSNKTCPKCQHKHFTEDRFCENCLQNMSSPAKQGYYARWIQ